MLSDERLAEIDEWFTSVGYMAPKAMPDWLKALAELRAEVDRLRRVIVVGSDRLTAAEAEVDRLQARLAAAEGVCEAWGTYYTSLDALPQLVYRHAEWVELCRQQHARSCLSTQGGQEPAQQETKP